MKSKTRTAVIGCENCGRPVKHEYVGLEYREHFYPSSESDKMIDGSGWKEIWACSICGEPRIYGAPSDGEIAKIQGRVAA